MSLIRVVAAVIQNAQVEILIAKRPDHLHQGGLWEFPGGKIEAGEPPIEALTRELQEELGISVCSAEPLLKLQHEYPDKSVELDFWRVYAFQGEPSGKEGQKIRWVKCSDLASFAFPAANQQIVDLLTKQQ